MERHMSLCTDCRAQLSQYEALHQRIRQGVIDYRQVMLPANRLTFAQAAPYLKRSRRAQSWRAGAMALATVFALAAVLLFVVNRLNQATVTPFALTPVPTVATVPPTLEAAPATVLPTPASQLPPTLELVWTVKDDSDPLRAPRGMALDRQGNVYVVDTGNARIVKYDRDGKFLTQWGQSGQADGQFDFANSGIALDQEGNVYVADGGNQRIQKFDANGRFLLKWGSDGFGPGQFKVPTGIVVDSQGNIYVGDYVAARIQKFDPNGELLPWKTQGVNNPPLVEPVEMAIDRQDSLYIADRGASVIRKFDRDGNAVASLTPHCDNNSNTTATLFGVAVDASGNLYLADGNESRICKFDDNGKLIVAWDNISNRQGVLESPVHTAVDNEENVYISDGGSGRISKYRQIPPPTLPPPDATPLTNDLKPVTTPEVIWTISNNPDPLNAPTSVTLDQQGNLYVVDTNNARILKYDHDGKFLTQWGSRGQADGQFSFASLGTSLYASVAVDHEGNVYVTDNDNQRIQKFDGTGHFLLKWGSSGIGAGQFVSPGGLAVDSQGNVLVADAVVARIQKFSSQGESLPWKNLGATEARLTYPIGVAIDRDDFVYVADRAAGSVLKFDTDGNLLASWELHCGSGVRDTVTPSGIALDTSGKLYVADVENARICQFDATGNFLAAWGGVSDEGGNVNPFGGIAVDAQGYVYVVRPSKDDVVKLRLP
jgi:sugar lactone lactonase YvrE